MLLDALFEHNRCYKFNHLGLINHWLIFFLLLKRFCEQSRRSFAEQVHLPKVSVRFEALPVAANVAWFAANCSRFPRRPCDLAALSASIFGREFAVLSNSLGKLVTRFPVNSGDRIF